MSPWDLFDQAVRWARSTVRDEDAARDIALAVVQEVRTDDVKGDKHLAARMRGLVHYRALDHMRRQRLDVVQGMDPDDVPGGESPEEIAEARSLSRAYAMKLSLNEELAMGLHIDGYSDDEIATALRTTPENVRQLRSRARAKWSDE